MSCGIPYTRQRLVYIFTGSIQSIILARRAGFVIRFWAIVPEFQGTIPVDRHLEKLQIQSIRAYSNRMRSTWYWTVLYSPIGILRDNC